MSDDSIPGPTPTGYQRTQGGGVKWQPPTAEHLGKLLPQYEVEALIGRGGMGAVYKDRQKSLDRPVAIKILPPEVDDEDDSYTERFKNEAKVMAKFTHPAIVAVHDFGETSEGQLFFIMEFVNGTDVHQMIEAQGRLPPEHALAITAHVCDALKYAHEHGVIHRDIKPSNVLINMEGAVKVADFGLAKLDEAGAIGLTKGGMAMGTPDFVAPETLIMGVNVDGRADLYAVGVMLYNMLTGNVPRGAFKPASVLVPGLDPRFDSIATRAMQHDRDERYKTAAEMRRDLDVILTTPMVKSGGPSSSAIPKQAVAQKPVAKGPQKPMGKSANVPVRSSQPPKQNAATAVVPPKSKTQLFIGIGAAAAIGLGAFVMLGGKKPDIGNDVRSLTSTAGADGAKSANSGQQRLVTLSPTTTGPIKVREEPKPAPVIVGSTPKPKTPAPAPEKKEEPKPVAASPAKPTPAGPAAMAEAKPVAPPPPAVTIAPAKPGPQPARLPDPAKWVKVFDTKESVLPFGSKAEWTKEGIRLNEVVMHLPDASATDAAVRAKIPFGPGIIILGLRNGASGFRTIGIDTRNHSIRVSKRTKAGKQTDLPIAEFPFDPPSATATEIEVEFIAVGKVLSVAVGGKVVGSLLDDEDPYAGNVTLYSSTGGIVRDIAWQSLDLPKPAAEKLATLPKMGTGQEQPGITIPELMALDAQFRKLQAERVTAPFEASVAKLNTGYVGGLDREILKEKAAGHLDGIIALEAEKNLIAQKQPVPPQDESQTAAALKGLRAIYRTAFAKLNDQRVANLKPIVDPFTVRLKQLETDLTKKDRVNDAKTVRQYREGLGTEADAQRAVASSKYPRADDRKAAEWVLKMGGSITIIEGGRETSVSDAALLPRGKFVIKYIRLNFTIEQPPKPPIEDLLPIAGLKGLEALRIESVPTLLNDDLDVLTSLPALTRLDLPSCNLTDGAFTTFAKLRTLQSLNLVGNGKISGTALLLIVNLNKLTDLSLQTCNLSEEGIKNIAQLTQLTRLDLPLTVFKDEDLPVLDTLKNLHELNVSGSKVTIGGLAQWKGISRLTKLGLTLQVGGGGNHCVDLAKNCPKLMQLHHAPKMVTDIISAQDIAAAAAFPKLEEFDVSRITDAAMPGLLEIPNLANIVINYSPITDAGLAALLPHKGLREIRFSESEITDAGLLRVAEMRKLKAIYLGTSPRVTDAGIATLKRARPDIIISR